MNVFIAGSSGVLGRSTIRQLVSHGHQAMALVRTEDKARVVKSLGASAVIGDIFNPAQVRDLVDGADAVLHLATAIPTKPRWKRDDWIANDRLRREGTRNLVEACRGRKIRAYVQQSIAFVYGNLHGAWVDESAPPCPSNITQSALEGEQIALNARRDWGLPAIVLRGAQFYHAESWSTRYFIGQIKRCQLPIIGDGNYFWHYIHVDDMARAVVCAVENASEASGEILNVADDEPCQAKEFLEFLANRIGAPRPMRVPAWLARLFAGSETVNFLTTSARYRTGKIKKKLGWKPQFPTYREGFAQILAAVAK